MATDAQRATESLRMLVGRSLLQLCVGAGDLQLRFDGGFAISVEGVVSVATGPPTPPYSVDALARLLPLLNGTVTAVEADETAGLTLTIEGVAVRCPADERFEAWNFTGPDGALVVSMPGGGFAIWTRT